MSRAFTREDDFVEDLPDRPISEHPNYVTERGFALIEAELDKARRDLARAQSSGEREALAVTAREMRYWAARRATAQVVPLPRDRITVQFGSRVAITRDNGREQTFQIVGEDEADPAQGSISYVAPLARALTGKAVGDSIRAGNGEAEIISID